MTERDTVQNDREAARQEARKFVARAVHDLREPLRAIRGCSELLLAARAEVAGDAESQRLRFIAEGVERTDELLRDIIDYCHTLLSEPELGPTNMNDVLREARYQLSNELKGCEATLTHDPLPIVTADFIGLTTVLLSLLQNACKFRREASLAIHISVREDASEWAFSVQDNGCGFNPAYQERIFQPFERLNGRQYPGSGLGLARSRKIIEQHGGRMWAESTPGEGSTFWFTVPREAP